MNEDLLAELREGVRSGSVPQPISGESIDDFRLRTAHAGAIIGIKWAQGLAEAIAVAQFESEAASVEVPDSPASLSDDDDVDAEDWRHTVATVAPLPGPVTRYAPGVPPEQNEAAGV